MASGCIARTALCCALAALLMAAPGCQEIIDWTDRDVAAAIREREEAALALHTGYAVRKAKLSGSLPGPEDREYVTQPFSPGIPPAFDRPAASQPASTQPAASSNGDVEPEIGFEPIDLSAMRYRDAPLTLTAALATAQANRRAFITAQEDLYLAALALTLERHLWTPQFSASLRTIYGNFGEASGFDQAMRFVGALGVTQRLPFGGEFTAQAISTLIRDVRQSITAAEGSEILLGLNIPLLAGAGHVAREELIQLERTLTYAVRDYERFRRRQLVLIAGEYFDLLSSKQAVVDAADSLSNARLDYERAQAIETADPGGDVSLPLDTRRAEQRLLSEQNRLEQLLEDFRFQTDQFKLQLGISVDLAIGIQDLEDIESIERQIEQGVYPLLRRPAAADDADLALLTALSNRLDLLTATDQIGDARRGVDIAQNALLPNLDFLGSLRFDTDPNHFNIAAFEFARANWRAEMVLAIDDRFEERTQLRAATIGVQRAERQREELAESIRVEVRRALNQILLQDRLIEIQRRNVEVAEFRRAYARQRFEDGELGNRDLVEAEDEWTEARNALNRAKTDLWTAVLGFRLATETLRIDDNGRQHADAS